MMIKRHCGRIQVFIFLLLLPLALHAQRKEFQSWWEAELAHEPVKDVDLSVELEQRFKNNSTDYDRSLITMAGTYKLLPQLRVAAGMRFLTVADREGHLYPKYRLHADVTGRESLGDVDLSLRARFQYGFEEFLSFSDIISNTFANRYRLKAAYHIFGTPLDVFASAEAWGVFRTQDGRFLKRMRYAAGLSYALGQKTELGIRYIFEDEVNQTNPLQSHIVVAGISHKF